MYDLFFPNILFFDCKIHPLQSFFPFLHKEAPPIAVQEDYISMGAVALMNKDS